MHKLHLILFTLILLPANIAAGQERPQSFNSITKNFPFETDFRLGHGVLPITYDFDFLFNCDNWDIDAYTFPAEYYDSQVYRGNKYTTGSLNLSHSVRLRKWLEFGLVVSYNGNFRNFYSTTDNSIVDREYGHSFFFTPTARFSWFTRERVRMYSSVGFGIGVMFSKEASYMHYSRSKREVTWGPSIQLTGFGISVGKTLFGFAEAGAIGTLGLFTAGIGYRIKPKATIIKNQSEK